MTLRERIGSRSRPRLVRVILVMCVGALVAPAHASVAHPDTLTIAQCAQQARRLAPAVTSTRHALRAAQQDSLAAARNGRPEFALEAGATLAPEGFYDPTVTNLGGYEARLGMSWTSHDGGRRQRERERARLAVRLAGADAALAIRDAGLDAAELACEALRLQHVIRLRADAIAWLDRLAALVRSGVASGGRSPSDSIRVGLERDAALASLESARIDSLSTNYALMDLFGWSAQSPIVIADESAATAAPPSANDSLRFAFQNASTSPEVVRATTLKAQRELEVADAAHANAATVEWTLDAGLAGADVAHAVPEEFRVSHPGATFADRLRRDLGASAAVHVHLPLFDRSVGPTLLARRYDLMAATDDREVILGAQFHQATVEIERWRSAARAAAAAQATAERAERALLKVKSLYGGGATPLLDLLDAWRTYQESQERVEEARQMALLTRFRVEDRR